MRHSQISTVRPWLTRKSSEDLYKNLRSALLERICDKEASIRVQSVIALSKLCGSEDPTEIEEGPSAIDVVGEVLSTDPSPWVPLTADFALPY